MSIKKLFGSTNKSRNYLSDTTEKNVFEDVESARNVRAIEAKQNTFVPQIDYAEPANFAKYGSAYLYYKSAVEHIYDYYPYDGSDAEINEFYNKLLDIEKYIFDNLYPRTNGYVRLSNDGWGSLDGSLSDGYGTPATPEYITFFGGPNTASYTKLTQIFDNPTNNKYQFSNIYNTDIYTSEGLPSDYASGSRESNLKADFDNGVTIEFWLKKDAFTNAKTEKEVIFDMWNNETSGSSDYGRIRVELDGDASGSPFLITALSGTSGIYQQSIGTNLTISSLKSFQHYAISLQNSGSSFVTKLYVTGAIEDTNVITGSATGPAWTAPLNALKSKNMMGRIGALLTPAASPAGPVGAATAGKLSASLDEFRFWKIARDSNQIARYYNDNIRGGANTDINNATLGIYFKFNEGITTVASTDSTVLDYSGRISNGVWTGYGSNSRTTSSAIVDASAASTEYKDPIIYLSHPDVTSLKTDLLTKGEYHDANNNAAFVNLAPSWVLEEDENYTSDLRLLSHIVAAYFDKLYLQISAVPSFKRTTYTSASAVPLPFAEHLPQSLGLYTPELFVDSSVFEKFLNRNQDVLFESDLNETKNLIYLNLYNSLAGIFKAKGTEKAIKNVFRCFYLDDKVLRLKTYVDSQTYELKDNLQLILAENTSINFNKRSNLAGVVYQKADSSNSNAAGFISGTYASDKEDRYGFTAEANIIFPRFSLQDASYDRDYRQISLFGMHEANTASADDTTWLTTDDANFQVLAIRDAEKSKNVYFKLTSSNSPYPFPTLTSSVFFDTYDNEQWNISVRIKPDNYPLATLVTGSTVSNYTLEFRGINAVGDTLQNNFLLTASLSRTTGSNFAKSAKRLYAGSRRTNVTGAILDKSDILFTSLKYWTKYLENNDVEQHLYDINNRGISGSYQNISALDSNLSGSDALNLNTLALNWTFDNITGSDSGGNFYYVSDISSGSADIRNNYDWIGGISGYQHTGYGYGFVTSSTDVINKERLNSLKLIDPEGPVYSEMVQASSAGIRFFPIPETRPKYFYTLEKSMYNAISEEMLAFFAGVVDFNNLIGEPVNRYRERYKSLEKLREIFFRRVTQVSDVEKFLNYYKWLDDAIAEIIAQLVPASARFINDTYNIIESHVLERNKYKTQFPTLEFKPPDLEAALLGAPQLGFVVLGDDGDNQQEEGLQDADASPRPHGARPNRFKSSGDTNVDLALKEIAANIGLSSDPNPVFLTDADGTTYKRNQSISRHFSKPYVSEFTRGETTSPSIIKGGVNFDNNKRIDFTYNALYPAGPTNQSGGIFVPQNVLLGFTADLVAEKSASFVPYPNKKTKRIMKVQHGRDWENATGYSNVKSSMAFPFNLISSSVKSGYNKEVIEKIEANVMITNLHNDVYGSDMEKPAQGPFTEFAVGGHQSRHISLNTGSDDYKTRPEAWKILLDTCDAIRAISGGIAMVGADYPWPEANAVGATPYPMTASQKAVYYRDHIAKRPVNIRNIHHTTGSTKLGNYNHKYEVVSSVGAFSNPRGFVDNQPTLPTQITNTPSASQGRSILDIRRDADNHFEFIPAYSINYLTASANKTIIRGKFSSGGGLETMGVGYNDIRSDEYSVYNAFNYRNLTVIRPNQNISGTVSEAVGSGTAGIRVSDIHGKDFGLRTHLARHAGRFGRDSTLVTNPGASYDQSPAFNKIQRNPRKRIIQNADGTFATSSQYDNFYVQHQIPRADRQYAWVTGSLASGALKGPDEIRYYGYAPVTGPQAGYYSSSATGWTAYFDFVSASSVLGKAGTASIYQPTLGLNIYVVDPIDANNDNNQGYALVTNVTNYYNNTLLTKYKIPGNLNRKADYFNLLMARRKNVFGYRAAPQTGPAQHPILRRHRMQNTFTAEMGTSQRYTVKPVTLRGRPASINVDIDNENVTLKTTYGNENLYFSDSELNERLLHNPPAKETPFSQIIDIANTSTNYKLNWVLYSETLFPSAINEFTSGSSTRVGYDNLYWRNVQLDRNNLHNDNVLTNSFGLRVSQSSWPLDAPLGFLTRSAISSISKNSTLALRGTNSAGELQNEYFHIVSGTFAVVIANKRQNLIASGLYSRKHTLPGPNTVVSPSGMPIPETGSITYTSKFTNVVGFGAGEAVWEADTQAGIVIKSGTGSVFQASSSTPWFDDYDAYKDDLTKVIKGYAVIPEFRISEHVEDYMKFGIDANNKFDTFEIVGTNKNSSQADFYKDYSNSEFMTEFLNVKEKTLLDAKEIMLVCSASIRLNPYNGFYPAQRTVELVKRFKNSFGNSIVGEDNVASVPNATSGITRPLMQTLFSPGLLYNTIKSGIAVDYPIITDHTKYMKDYYGNITTNSSTWMITTQTTSSSPGIEGYEGGSFWDYRIPFEALIKPEKYLNNLRFFDFEPHPSASLNNVTSSFRGEGDPLYSMMASNFFGEVGNFFLKDGAYTRLESNTVTSDLEFKSGSIFGARLKIRRSMSGSRVYRYESGSSGNNLAYGQYGGRAYNSTTKKFTNGVFPLPQDPRQAPKKKLQEDFTMYSRPTAFGPPIAGRPSSSYATSSNVALTDPADSAAGFNWAYTPPYYNGEAWLDFIFAPTHDTKYDLEKILAEAKTVFWRADPGISASVGVGASVALSGTQLLPTFSGSHATHPDYGGVGDLIYDGANVNLNAMQITASINCFGVERVTRQRMDQFGNPISSENETVGKKWVIQPKMETPMLNFNNLGAHPITNAASNLSLPTYSSASVPRGMWHQFGIIDPDPAKGIFLEIGDIPVEWLKYHYEVVNNNSAYNKENASLNGAAVHRRMKSLTDVVKFDNNNISKRLGELADALTIREAIVAIPYQTIVSTTDSKLTNYRQQNKTFFPVDRKKINACLDSAIGSKEGDSLETAGESIRKLVQKMQRYNLPPQFDFINNLTIDPMAMYIFEFEYTFDKDDLSYIWQNLAPRNYKKITKTATSIAHPFADNELLDAESIVDENTRWMIFKVKQRSYAKYEDQVISQIGESANKGEIFEKGTQNKSSTYPLEFNWPYDYISFVESVKFDTEILYQGSTKQLSKGKLSAGNFNQQAKNGQVPQKGSTGRQQAKNGQGLKKGSTRSTATDRTTNRGRNRGGGNY